MHGAELAGAAGCAGTLPFHAGAALGLSGMINSATNAQPQTYFVKLLGKAQVDQAQASCAQPPLNKHF